MGAERKGISRIGKGFLFPIARVHCKGILAWKKVSMEAELVDRMWIKSWLVWPRS
jgi:hypothetical protein